MKKIFTLFFNFFIIFFIFSELKFTPLSINENNDFIFNSIEKIGNREEIKTLFSGNFKNNQTNFKAISFYPENLFYNEKEKKIYIQNRIGLYCYDILNEKMNDVSIYPSFTNKSEFLILKPARVSFSYDYKYAIGKVLTSPTKASIYLYDLVNNKSYEIVKDVEIMPGYETGLWSIDSNYFIYQKNNKIYYFSLLDFFKNKSLSEEWRWIADVSLKNCYWTEENYLLWIENNILYKANPSQFFSRSIYKNYLRQGEIFGKIPFTIEPAFDSIVYNDKAKKFLIVKDGNSIYYYSLLDDIKNNPYIQLNDNIRFDKAFIFSNGEGVISLNVLLNGTLNKSIFLIKKDNNNNFQIINFYPNELENLTIYGISINRSETGFLVNTSKGCYYFNFNSLKNEWSFEDEPVIESINISDNQWIVGGRYITYLIKGDIKIFKPLFASSINDAGFINNEIGVILNNNNFTIDREKRNLIKSYASSFELKKENSNKYYRLLSREINKGFYKEGVYIKELFSGKQFEVTGLPILRYKLYQPEITLDYSYFYSPNKEKYEIAFLFDCIKTGEGIFPILTAINDFKITGSFFINGEFISINKTLTKIISEFDVEVANMFQYYVDLTNNNFMIDRTFIRQGLSINEERFFEITNKNFSPYWHAPMFSFNETIVTYAKESGYTYISYNLDSLDWVGLTNRELREEYYMNSSALIERILNNIKPGMVIKINTGKNFIIREDWLFNDFEILVAELIRSGYTFTTTSDIIKKYREY
ncbi:MAG TPA: hypothetical protein PLE45_04260 [Spirochaetota bacterium]|nr:hypothetical protein [Spirochaetota bacterium]